MRRTIVSAFKRSLESISFSNFVLNCNWKNSNIQGCVPKLYLVNHMEPVVVGDGVSCCQLLARLECERRRINTEWIWWICVKLSNVISNNIIQDILNISDNSSENEEIDDVLNTITILFQKREKNKVVRIQCYVENVVPRFTTLQFKEHFPLQQIVLRH